MSESNEGQAQVPDDHPEPVSWWKTIQYQSWVCLAAMIVQAPAIIVWGLPDAGTAPLVVINLGLVSGFAAYGGGSVLIDAIRAWRCPDAQ